MVVCAGTNLFIAIMLYWKERRKLSALTASTTLKAVSNKSI
jgi:hypothetical protein